MRPTRPRRKQRPLSRTQRRRWKLSLRSSSCKYHNAINNTVLPRHSPQFYSLYRFPSKCAIDIMQPPTSLYVVLRHIKYSVSTVPAATPAAIYRFVLSTGSGSVLGDAVFGYSAASAIVANSSEILVQLALTCIGADIPSARVYSSGCRSERCVVLSRSALSAA